MKVKVRRTRVPASAKPAALSKRRGDCEAQGRSEESGEPKTPGKYFFSALLDSTEGMRALTRNAARPFC